MGQSAATWFREQHTCNAYCRDDKHAQMVFLHEDVGTLAEKKSVSDQRYGIRTIALEPAREFDRRGYCAREWDRHGRPWDNFDDPGTPYLLIFEYATTAGAAPRYPGGLWPCPD
jgi:hypothetical protein